MATQDMQGKTVVITGASAGLGAAAARQLAERGATVVPVGRSPQKTAAVARELGVEPLVADFARLDDVRRLADALLERCERIDVLANNAGGIFPRRVETVDGHELTFQVNHLAPFLLTVLLHPRLAATPGARVLMTSSIGNNLGHVKLDDLDRRRTPYLSLRVYGTAKLENILMAREIGRRWAGDGIAATAFHPGNVATEFGRDSFSSGLIYRSPLRRVFLITPEEGAAALVGLATQPDANAIDGVYFDRFEPNGRTSKQAGDADLARGLWERSAALVAVGA
jgi:NAD(P)-dependent dehydrogenase (short-subunit alcohol dehydrogenase family)